MSWKVEQLATWTPAHLYAAAPFMLEQAPMWLEHFTDTADRMMTLEWKGHSGDAAYDAARYNQQAGFAAHDTALAGGTTTTDIAEAATAMHSQILDQMGQATGSGFLVVDGEEGIEVKDPANTVYPTAAAAKARQEQAEIYAQMIDYYLGHFQSVLDTGARAQKAHAETLRTTQFSDGVTLGAGHQDPHIHMGTDQGGVPQIQMGGAPIPSGGFKATPVDNHTFKTDGPQPLPPQEPTDPHVTVVPPPPMSGTALPQPGASVPGGAMKMPPHQSPTTVITQDLTPPPEPRKPMTQHEQMDSAEKIMGGLGSMALGGIGVASGLPVTVAGAAGEVPTLGLDTPMTAAGATVLGGGITGIAVGATAVADGIEEFIEGGKK